MNRDADIFWIWFQLVFGIGTRRAELLMNYFEHPRQIYEGVKCRGRAAGMMGEKELELIDPALEQAGIIQKRTLKKGVDIITPEDEAYPALLKQIYSKPAALYVKGDLSCLKGRLAIAMVGTRKHSEYGRDAAAWIARGLVRGDAIVVSGLAHGIDTECHMAALKAGGKSIGVLGCGIDIDYPKGNADVKRLMCENGAVVTEYPLKTEPRAMSFPIRNRIISGMSHGVVVVEADLRSGSLLTASLALEQGRDVFAVPGSVFSSHEQGTHKLIREGAKLTESAQDIFDEYEYLGLYKNVGEKYNSKKNQRISYSKKPPVKNKEAADIAESRIPKEDAQKNRALPDGISGEAARVYGAIYGKDMTVDLITEASGLEVSSVLTALTELEIYGVINSFPGRKFGISTN